jgi:hypothetical protein
MVIYNIQVILFDDYKSGGYKSGDILIADNKLLTDAINNSDDK